nr:phosphatase PAP2 family protein [Nocardioides sp.]
MTLLLPAPAVSRAREVVATRRARSLRSRPALVFAAHQAVLLAAAVATYFVVRSLTAGSAPVAERNADLLVGLERSLGVFVEQDVQRLVLAIDGAVPVLNAIYIWGHWPVIAAVLGWLAWRRRDVFPVYRNALLISGLVGMVIVATFPVAPPRLMDLGFLDTVTMHSEAYRVLQPPAFTNQYAAMPSFHVGWDLLMGIALVREGGRAWLRVVGAALPLLMLVTVVATGNHYLVDAVVGDAIVLASLRLATWHHRSRDRDLVGSRAAARPESAAAGQGPDGPRVLAAAGRRGPRPRSAHVGRPSQPGVQEGVRRVALPVPDDAAHRAGDDAAPAR